MARLTVEDSLNKVGNLYELVALATKRARQLLLGKDSFVDEDNDKPTVVALREIAQGFVTSDNIDTIGKHNIFNDLESAKEEQVEK